MAREPWDVAVVGAGPAGALAATLLARQRRKVVLLEKAPWPREKTCGGCISAAAIGVLQRAGLGGVLATAEPLHLARWHVGRQRLDLRIGRGAAMPRHEFDTALVAQAVLAGCTFLPATSATLEGQAGPGEHRTLVLTQGNTVRSLCAAVVLAADGIVGTLLANQAWAQWELATGSFFGVAATSTSFPHPPPKGQIHMHAGPGGYVGLVRWADGRTHLAAALSPEAARGTGGPVALIARILNSTGQAVPGDLAGLHGTAYLTRHRKALGAHRVLTLGDACSYIEPFTGEGIAWALKSAEAVVALLPPVGAPWPEDLPDRWLELHRQVVARSQWLCRVLRPMMHRPTLAAAGLRVGQALPMLKRFLIAAQS